MRKVLYVVKLALITSICMFSSASAGYCPRGDVSGDCIVNLNDLVLLADDWLENPECSGLDDCTDITGNNIVNVADFAIVAENWQKVVYPILINEYMSDNENTIEDPDQPGATPDWVEIFNYGSVPIDLAGLYMSDEQATPLMWMIPLGYPAQTTVPPGGLSGRA